MICGVISNTITFLSTLTVFSLLLVVYVTIYVLSEEVSIFSTIFPSFFISTVYSNFSPTLVLALAPSSTYIPLIFIYTVSSPIKLIIGSCLSNDGRGSLFSVISTLSSGPFAQYFLLHTFSKWITPSPSTYRNPFPSILPCVGTFSSFVFSFTVNNVKSEYS